MIFFHDLMRRYTARRLCRALRAALQTNADDWVRGWSSSTFRTTSSRRVQLGLSHSHHHGRCDAAYHETMSRPTNLMYAELLSNIRQVSVIAELEQPSNSSTKVELSSDGHQFLLRHDGQAIVLTLPGAASTSLRLPPSAAGSKELSWRLPLAGEPADSNAESDAPWPAKDLSESTEFLCRSCGGVVVGRGNVKEWRDLPSENWAEMMDFWHCHKPSVPPPSGSGHSHDDPAMSRGYGANTKFIAQPRIGFVDLTTLLVAEADCPGVEVRYFSLVSCHLSFSLHEFHVGIKKAAKPALLCNDLVTDTNTRD